jgi:hypothetical protein
VQESYKGWAINFVYKSDGIRDGVGETEREGECKRKEGTGKWTEESSI